MNAPAFVIALVLAGLGVGNRFWPSGAGVPGVLTIPAGLQDAMSRQAQAEREKAARVILGSAELEIAQDFVSAAKLYAQNPAALQLRTMNIIYETTRERGTTILIPTSMVDAMKAGGALGLASLAKPGSAA